jgi:hypothetical protein
MRKILVGVITAMLLGASVVESAQPRISAAAQQPKIPEHLWQEVQSKGTIRIQVVFNLHQESLRNLSKEEKIAAAQDMLLAELSGTKFRVTGRFRSLTGMGLYVDPEGLSILERSSLVDKVIEEIPERAS